MSWRGPMSRAIVGAPLRSDILANPSGLELVAKHESCYECQESDPDIPSKFLSVLEPLELVMSMPVVSENGPILEPEPEWRNGRPANECPDRPSGRRRLRITRSNAHGQYR